MAIIVAAIYLLVTRIWHPSLLNKHRLVKCQSGIEDLPDGMHFEDIRKPPVVLTGSPAHRIALGIAQGLSYLHHDSVPQIIHRDLKSDNVMLDSEMEPKIETSGLLK
ncbi:hypothetical protein HAX54_016029 [Datura stramonium]|uniref:Protein kinase domain-containing protein n=1 Tax=Datura stramonium TaxID=4076 RepID=A0ABS8S0B9_DATST|nr:hypothetical protein [Datura stramonium]